MAGTWNSRVRLRRTKPPVDIDAVAMQARFGSHNEDVARDMSAQPTAARPSDKPTRLLEAQSIALVAFRKAPHVHLFDSAGTLIGIVPSYLLSNGRPPKRCEYLYFMDRRGVAFTMRHPSIRTLRPLTTDVWSGRNGDLIGSFDSRRTRLVENPAPRRVLSLPPKDGGRILLPNGAAQALYKTASSEYEGLFSTDDELWASLRAWPKGGEKYAWVRWIAFRSDAPPNVRAVALAAEICQQLGHFRDEIFND